jgi:hypothetical protein
MQNAREWLLENDLFKESSYTNSQNHIYPEFLISESRFLLLVDSYLKKPQKYEEEVRHVNRYKRLFKQAKSLAKGQALVKFLESNMVVLVRMAPSPFELERDENKHQIIERGL